MGNVIEPLGTREAGRIANRHPRTIVNWIRKNLLKAMKLPGEKGPYIIDKADLLETIAKLTTPQPYDPEGKHES